MLELASYVVKIYHIQVDPSTRSASVSQMCGYHMVEDSEPTKSVLKGRKLALHLTNYCNH